MIMVRKFATVAMVAMALMVTDSLSAARRSQHSDLMRFPVISKREEAQCI